MNFLKISLILVATWITACANPKDLIKDLKDLDTDTTVTVRYREITANAGRSYTVPAVFKPHKIRVGNGIAELPPTIIADGNAGQGYVMITVWDRFFCYKGQAASLDELSNVFLFVGETATGSSTCEGSLLVNGGLTVKLPFHPSGDVEPAIRVEVIGGRCGTNCLTTNIVYGTIKIWEDVQTDVTKSKKNSSESEQ